MTTLARFFLDLPLPLVLLAKITVLLAVGWLLHFAFVNRNPRLRVLSWRLVMVGLVILPISEVALPRLNISVAVPKQRLANRVATATNIAPSPFHESSDRAEPSVEVFLDSGETPLDHGPSRSRWTSLHPVEAGSLSVVLVVTWLLVLSTVLVRVLRQRRLSRCVVSMSDPAPETLTRMLHRIADDLSVYRCVELRVNDGVVSPFLTGWFRLFIVLPTQMVERSSDEELEHVLAHEVSHLKSGDQFWVLLGRIIAASLWFHPLIWKLCAAHRLECETVCDATAATYGGQVARYSRTLARIALTVRSKTPDFGITMGRTSEITQRLHRLEAGVQCSPLARGCVRGALLLAAAASLGLGSLTLVEADEFLTAEQSGRDSAATVDTILGDSRFTHSHFIWAELIGFGPNGRLIASASPKGDRMLRFWDVRTGEERRVLSCSRYGGLTLSGDHKTVFIGRRDGVVEVIDVVTGRRRQEIPGPAPRRAILIASRDGQTLVSIDSAAPGEEPQAKLWDTDSGALRLVINLPGARMAFKRSFALSPDGRTFASRGLANGAVVLWDAETGRQVQTIRFPESRPHTSVRAICFSPDSKQVAISRSSKAMVRIFDRATGNELVSLRTEGYVYAMGFSRDGLLFATRSSRGISVWNPASGANVWSRRCPKLSISSLNGAIAFDPSGGLVASTTGNAVRIYDSRSGKEPSLPGGRVETLVSIAVCPTDDRLATGGASGRIRIWDLNGKQIRSWQAHQAKVGRLAYSPDGKILASAADDDVVALWNASSGALLHEFDQGIDRRPYYLQFSTDGRTLGVTVGHLRTNLWDVETRELQGHLEGIHGGLRGPLAFHPNGESLFMIDSSCRLARWNLKTGLLDQTVFDKQRVFDRLALSPDGKYLALSSTRLGISVWRLGTDRVFELKGASVEPLGDLACSPDSSMLASTFGAAKVQLWDLPRGNLRKVVEFDGDEGQIHTVRFSNDGKSLITVHGNGTVHVRRINAAIASSRPRPRR
ncbi:MAG: PQQ-binding-like beta-propeller repeat protein [Planctomycetota bacterium]|nr:PQQ-binding-like beta-propeller repeat protein [Planctomycetota bacterium]